MKKLFIIAAMALASVGVNAQNIQLHYDFGKHMYQEQDKNNGNRQDVTLTYETFKADNLGSWYYFIDVDIDQNGVRGAYTEVSREFNIGKQGFAAHVEFDGGLSRYAGSFQPAALAGIAWNGHNADFSTTYSIQAMYKQFFGQSVKYGNSNHGFASLQLTGVWSTTFCNDKLTFAGFIDFWRDQRWNNGHGCMVILSEPQLWYNVSKKFSFGTEIEFSNNFVNNITDFGDKTFYVNPTIAAKFNL